MPTVKSLSPYADPSEVADFAQDLSDSFLHCREMGHTWRPYTAKYIPAEHSYERVIRCTRCKTRRVQILSDRGAVITNHYVYPDGYQSKGLGRITGDGRDRLRLETLHRILGDAEKVSA